jgi:hypothetical protein
MEIPMRIVPQSKPPQPVHVPGTFKGEELALRKGREAGRGAQRYYRDARDSTSIDPTRGGVASALNEIAETAGVGIRLDEASIPISEEVKGACEILGLDPLYVANEGKLLAIVSPS